MTVVSIARQNFWSRVLPNGAIAGFKTRGLSSGLRQLLDFALIGSMWRCAADRIDAFISDNQVEVGAIVAEGVIAWQIQLPTSLPPSMLRTNDAVGQCGHEPGTRAHTSLWCHDGNPVTFADAPHCRSLRADLYERFGQRNAEPRQVSVLA